ncbi:MAG: peptidylprolyl isomerase [Myxococcales bacterium]|nr:peptidylprolyl isomerase [Myxococcales bacterium]
MSRVRAATFVGLGCLLAACPSSRPGRGTPGVVAPTVPDDRPLRISVARAEAQREDGVHELEEVLRASARPGKLLALRGLGRIGGANARRVLLASLGDPDPEVTAVAMAAIGVARELDELSVEDNAANVEALHAAFANTTGAGRVLAIEALGRAGDQRSQPLLVAELAGTPEVAEAAGIALARHGRRKIALTPATLTAVISALTSSPDARTRSAATYALARAHVPTPPSDPAVPGALMTRVADADPGLRAQAILAIVKFKLVSTAGAQLTAALLDRDWKVAVEAVRALTGDQAEAASADAVATALVRRLPALDDGVETEAHVILEGLRGLQKSGARPVVATTLRTLTQWASTTTKAPALTRAWIECLATSAYARGANQLAPVAACSGGALPDHLRLPLVADLITAKVGSLAERRTQLGTLLAHKDVRVRAAALGALTAAWKESTEADHRSTIGILVSALASPEPILAGTAVEATDGFYEAIGAGDHATIDAAVIARAAIEKDPDLSGPLLELIGKRKLAAGLDACRAGLAGGPGRAKAARGCLSALGEAVPEAASPAHAVAPPVDVSAVIGASLEWHLVTTRGELVIELRPDVAPWAVASIVALTTKGSYDGLEFHRVVPGFVVQGGDPTESGSGGPGYALPAEPGTAADGPGYVTGGVGMADSGRDSAGSQWFVMHARAAHLDGRYTWVGSLRSGQNSADALLIGDKVVKATIAIKSAAHN